MIGQVDWIGLLLTLIMIGERIKDCLKNGELTNIEFQTMVEKQSGNTHKEVQVNGRKNEGRREREVSIMLT